MTWITILNTFWVCVISCKVSFCIKELTSDMLNAKFLHLAVYTKKKKNIQEICHMPNKFGICYSEILIIGSYGQMFYKYLTIFWFKNFSLLSTVGNLRLINNYWKILSPLSLHPTLRTKNKA